MPKNVKREHHLADVKITVGDHKHAEPPIIKRRRKTGNRKPMRFASLHHHSTFSYKDGFQLPDAHIRRAEELQMGAIGWTEHGNVSSHVKAEVAAEGTGVKSIFGVELYTGPVGEEAQQTKNHLTVLAKDPAGYRNLMALVSRSFEEGFYHEPTVDGGMLNAHKKGLVILSGCQGSLLFTSAVGGKGINPSDASYKRARNVARKFKRAFGDNYFLEVQAFPELELTRRANPMFERLSKELGIPLVASMDVHYTELDEREIQMILHNIRGGGKKTIEETAREWGYDVPLCPPPNDRAILRRLQQTGLSRQAAIEAILSTEEIAGECNVTLPRLEMVKFPVPRGYKSAHEVWEAWLKEGWRKRGFNRLKGEERRAAIEQLRKEKQIMEDKGFIDYMLIVADAIRFVKDMDVFVGPARGSAAASLVCYLLRITEVNPLIFPNLVFERFIDVSREDLPDIDIDFPSEVRSTLRDYLIGKYGEGCVSNIGTFTYFKNKLALDDVARVFKVPKGEVEKVKSFLIERSSGDLRASSTIEDTAEQFEQVGEVFERRPELRKSQLLEGNIKGFGVHAAGLVVSNHPIADSGVCAIYERELPKGSGNIVQVVSIDKYDAERQGLVKMDFLGLNTASMIEESRLILGWTNEDFYALPLDDEEVYDAFRANDVVGVFQMDGRACRYVCGALKPDNFAEVCDVNALARPGALHNGSAREYSEIKHGKITPQRVHPAVDPILEPTKYQIVYQEQILRICREVGNFPWEKTAEIRKIIAKKHGEQAFNRRKRQFMDGVRTVHKRMDVPRMHRRIGERLWGEMITAGSYGFNAAHATAYGFLAYYTMWLKVHHPDIFFSTSLKHLADEKQTDLLRDAQRHGIRIVPPHPSRSGSSWRPIRNNGRPRKPPTVMAGFEQINGIGEKMAAVIEEHREANGLENWDSLLAVKGIGPKTVESIKHFVGRDDPFDVFALDRNIQAVKKEIKSGKLGLPKPTHTSIDIPYELGHTFELTWLGTIVKKNIRDLFEANMARKGEALDPKDVKDPDLHEFALLTCEDENDQLLVRIDRWKFPMFKKAIYEFREGRDLLLVKGIRPSYNLIRQINVKELYVIDPEED